MRFPARRDDLDPARGCLGVPLALAGYLLLVWAAFALAAPLVLAGCAVLAAWRCACWAVGR